MASDKPEIRIRISKIREIEFSCRDIPDNIDVELGKNLFFALGFTYSPDTEKNTFALKTHVRYTLKEKQDSILTFTNEILFDIIGLNEAVRTKKDTNEIEINNNFLIPLISVAIGTTRGMIAVKVTGKRISEFPLPILNPKEVLDQLNKK